MLNTIKTVFEGGQGEIIEKKSRFIATVLPVDSEEEALRFLEQMRKQYWNATHNCFAYVIGEHHELQRCSDDGEPAGTAGRPMLEVLLSEDIHNVAVVVTRYFGGTLLGTGGLVRAYTKAVQEGLSNSVVVEKIYGARLSLSTDYSTAGKVQYLLAQNQIVVLDSFYTDSVAMDILVPVTGLSAFQKTLMEGTGGQVQITENGCCYYAVINERIELFE